ncbi:MAG: hypothetical protein RJB01_1377, partial [Actinomycetota bacterium]
IIAQQPASGESIEQGQSVNVTISAGKEQATVPQLLGLTSLDDIRTALADANLALGEVLAEDSNQPAGYVIGQDPTEGTQVAAGSPVNVTVSSGLVTVPDVVGLSQAQALSDLTRAGFETQVIEQEIEGVTNGEVLAQSPQPGSPLERGALVTITVALAPVVPTEEPTPTDVPVPTEEPIPTVEPQPTDQPPAPEPVPTPTS